MSVPNTQASARYSNFDSAQSRGKENLQKCTLGGTHNVVLFFSVFFHSTLYVLFRWFFFHLLREVVLYLVENKVFTFPVEGNWVVTAFLVLPPVYVWDKYFHQGFETNPFVSVISYLQNQIGKGNLLSGVPVGLALRLGEKLFGVRFSPVREKLFSANAFGLIAAHNSLFTSLLWPWLPGAFKQLFKSLGALVLKPSRTCGFFPFVRNELKNIHVSFSKLLDLAFVEFVGSFLVFLALTISLQNNHPKHMNHLVVAVKLMVLFIGNTVLKPIEEGPGYSGSVIVAFAVASNDVTALVFKLFANLAAAAVVAKLFEKPKHLKEKVPSPHEWPNSRLGHYGAALEQKLT